MSPGGLRAGVRGARFVGQRIPRREDLRFLTGKGTYLDDINMPGMAHVAFARSHVARGTISSIDTGAAASMPGVIAVLLAGDLNHLVREWWVDFEGPEAGAARPFRVLANGDVRFVGEPVAMVIADSRYLAEDALEALDIDIEPLPAMVEMERALDADAPIVHPDLGSNLAMELPAPSDPELEAAFSSASGVLTDTFHQHRYTCVPMETRGIIASWDPFAQELTVWNSTQGPHGVRGLLSRALGIDESRIRVVMPDVGGAFGQKMFPIPEEIAVALAARLVHRPLKWVEDRRENLMSGQHAREDRVTVSLAFQPDGTIMAAKADFLECLGSFPAAGSNSVAFSAMLLPGPYRIPRYGATGRAVYTNTAGRCSYRGPWMIETLGRELMMDQLARHLGLDPLELRRRNVVRESDLPYTTATGLVYDQMTAAATLEQAAEVIGYENLREQQRKWREQGRLVGIGISLFAEPSGIAMGSLATEAASVRVGPNGRVDVVTSSASHGQSVETTLAQVVAEELGVEFDQVRVTQGDTATTPFGPGTGGSRSAVLSSGAAREAAQQVRAKLLDLAAHRLEAAPEDLEIASGRVRVVGTPTRGTDIAEVARASYTDPASLPEGHSPGLEAEVRYTPSSPFTWSNACHICACEVDPDTGAVKIFRYAVSEDCGIMINPNVVEGQIAGGVVQGIGGVLFEHMKYDEQGNPLATTFVDYLLPTAAEVPVIEYGHLETPAPTNPGGHKGLGEGGAIGSPAAVINAVADALAPLGVEVRSQPLSPSEVAYLIESAANATR